MMPSQVTTGWRGLYSDRPCVDNAELVPNNDGNDDGYSLSSPEEGEPIDITGNSENSPTSQENDTHGLLSIRQALKGRKVSKRATDIIMASWRLGTQKQYTTHIKRWFQYCSQRKIDSFQTKVSSEKGSGMT